MSELLVRYLGFRAHRFICDRKVEYVGMTCRKTTIGKANLNINLFDKHLNYLANTDANLRTIPAKCQPQNDDFKKKSIDAKKSVDFPIYFAWKIQCYVRHGRKIGLVSLALKQSV